MLIRIFLDSLTSYRIGGGGVAVSIAKGAANQAHAAIEKQELAGQQAAFVAKNALAAQARQASQTAAAAVAGKQSLVNTLQQVNGLF